LLILVLQKSLQHQYTCLLDVTSGYVLPQF
jgi:hypothetical protein